MTSAPRDTIEALTYEAREAIGRGSPYSALAIVLMLPDICGNVDFPNAGSQSRYVRWCDANLADDFGPYGGDAEGMIASGDLYALRCSMLHQASGDVSVQRAKEKWSKVQVTTELEGSLPVSLASYNDQIWVSVEFLTDCICRGVEAWLTEARNDPARVAILADMLTIRPSPFHAAIGDVTIDTSEALPTSS
ncbi:MAG: hypothetical protein IR164_18055 [Devosia sp.]|uniref:hypothetical protein n=1 Tax=Devosia sp. TaxID=1871048 RepID=UPI001A027689|nr:hypothetical protein [Devosia sp.]MBF0680833.1 hypothetical protein [Devosia sp.]